MDVLFNNQTLTNLFVKAFAVVFSILFLMYSLVLRRQTIVMLNTVQIKNNTSLKTVANMHIIVSLLLLILSLLVL